jgi:hypothetical protein
MADQIEVDKKSQSNSVKASQTSQSNQCVLQSCSSCARESARAAISIRPDQTTAKLAVLDGQANKPYNVLLKPKETAFARIHTWYL